jgi:RNA polymerase sigma factor (sigma-70 family)
MSPRIPIRVLRVQSDERLVRLAGEGQERAFEALVHRYRRPLLRYCRRLGLSDSHAEDALQLTLLKAWQALAGGAQVREPGAWLHRIAHNVAISALRGAAERDACLTRAERLADVRAVEGGQERRIAVSNTLAGVAALPDMQRQALVLTAIEGKTHDEVAGALGIKREAVRGLLYRARSTLRSAAALLPQPLIGWVSGGSRAAGTTSPSVAEVAGAGGAGGTLAATGALLKGATLAIGAGALIGAAAIVPLGRGSRGARVGVHTAALVAMGTRARVPPAVHHSAQPLVWTGAAGSAHRTRAKRHLARVHATGPGVTGGPDRLSEDGAEHSSDQRGGPGDRASEELPQAPFGAAQEGDTQTLQQRAGSDEHAGDPGGGGADGGTASPTATNQSGSGMDGAGGSPTVGQDGAPPAGEVEGEAVQSEATDGGGSGAPAERSGE